MREYNELLPIEKEWEACLMVIHSKGAVVITVDLGGSAWRMVDNAKNQIGYYLPAQKAESGFSTLLILGAFWLHCVP